MSEGKIEIGRKQAHYNKSGTQILKYSVEVFHTGLNEHRVLSAPDINVLNNKISLQVKQWNDKWERLDAKRRIAVAKEASQEIAQQRTEEALEAIRSIDNILLYTLSVNDQVDWERLKNNEPYREKSPPKPSEKTKNKYPPRPNKQSAEFTPVFTFLDKIVRTKKEMKIQDCENKFQAAISQWEMQKHTIDEHNKQLDKAYEDALRQWQTDVAQWESRQSDFLQEQATLNAKIDQMKEAYLSQNNAAITEYCEIVLNNSEYPDAFPKNFELEYNSDNRILIIEYELPTIECFPKVKEVKYLSSKNELKEYFISDSQSNKMFDDTIYKITLRTFHEVFEADVVNAIDAISFNGWVKAINKATGKEEQNCILTIQVTKCSFMELNLSQIDPKTCFKSLKGIASSKLSTLTPIQPILQISKVDKRFIEGYDVADMLDNKTNLAAMDWEDFEHLIRELFEKEFKTGGGEVKVTQASRDGGVDAIAFDPDPIRGGKIVIQAKRYTNTVGVSAVRDLYGTVMNEGATKGILVSTADYGSDAYEFAKGKPLTLLNGSNLLHLLEKHGHHARIDLREAKKILAEKDQ